MNRFGERFSISTLVNPMEKRLAVSLMAFLQDLRLMKSISKAN